MKSRPLFLNCSVSFFLMTIALAMFSWVGSIYGLGEVQSLLSAEGMRWVLSHVVENYVQTPALGVVLFLLMGLGVGASAGIGDVLKRLFHRERQLSRKERRALTWALLTIWVYGGMIVLMMALPWNFLQSITGTWLNSPFSKGFIYILSIGLGFSGMVFGYVSDAFHSIRDVIDGMSCLIARYSSYFVSLFFIVQFFASAEYVGLADCIGLSDIIFGWIFHICCYFPLLGEVLTRVRNK